MSPRKKEDTFNLFRDHLDLHMNNVNSKLDKLDGRMDNVDVTLVKQQSILDEHVRRTNVLEAKVEPLQTMNLQVKTLLKIGAVIMATGAGGLGLKQLFNLLFGG